MGGGNDEDELYALNFFHSISFFFIFLFVPSCSILLSFTVHYLSFKIFVSDWLKFPNISYTTAGVIKYF